MKHMLSPLTKDLIEALVASAGLWLGRVLAALLSPRASNHSRRLARVVRIGESWVEELIVVLAGRRRGRARVRRRLVFAVPGFRMSRGNLRLFYKSVGVRLRDGGLIARVQRLLAALADPARYVARVLRRLARGLCLRRLVACAPAAVAFVSAAAQAVAISDSS
jgi:hypothetical protein